MAAVRAMSARNTDRQLFDAAHEAGIDPLRLADHLDAVETPQHFLPHDLQLQFGEPHADAAVNAKAERKMGAGPGTVDDEFLWSIDAFLVADDKERAALLEKITGEDVTRAFPNGSTRSQPPNARTSVPWMPKPGRSPCCRRKRWRVSSASRLI